jgi:hypothetical protein
MNFFGSILKLKWSIGLSLFPRTAILARRTLESVDLRNAVGFIRHNACQVGTDTSRRMAMECLKSPLACHSCIYPIFLHFSFPQNTPFLSFYVIFNALKMVYTG